MGSFLISDLFCGEWLPLGLHGLTAITGAVALAALVANWRWNRDTGSRGSEQAVSRLRFTNRLGMIMNGYFLAVIALEGSSVFLLGTCG